jgi:hypothetical protein
MLCLNAAFKAHVLRLTDQVTAGLKDSEPRRS